MILLSQDCTMPLTWRKTDSSEFGITSARACSPKSMPLCAENTKDGITMPLSGMSKNLKSMRLVFSSRQISPLSTWVVMKRRMLRWGWGRSLMYHTCSKRGPRILSQWQNRTASVKLCGISSSIFSAYTELGLMGVVATWPALVPEGSDLEISITPELDPPEGSSRWRLFLSELIIALVNCFARETPRTLCLSKIPSISGASFSSSPCTAQTCDKATRRPQNLNQRWQTWVTHNSYTHRRHIL